LKFDSFKADSSEVYLSWSNVNFSVPLKKEDRLLVE
jgi:ABC-type multidrug transport system fused ATPase/permease subunit